MYIFFDTETTGLPKNWKAPITNLDNWPRMVQIAWVTYNDAGEMISENDYIIKPEGFTIPAAAIKIHGISTERAEEKGVPLKAVLEKFSEAIKQTKYLIAHNIKFDEKIVGAEFIRKSVQNPFSEAKKLCTMALSTDFCKISGPYGYKWPKLSELHLKLFGVDFEEAHDAAVDVGACSKCFFELKRLGIIKV